MPKILNLLTNEIQEKSDAWILHNSRKIGTEFELAGVSGSSEVILDKLTGKELGSESTKEKAFMALSEGDRDSVRKGYKELVLRKTGWILRDCSNKAIEEIHISLPDRTEQIKNAKDSAILRAKNDEDILRKFKEILKLKLQDEDFLVSIEEGDSDRILEMIEKLSIGVQEVETLKVENERLRRLLGKK